MSGLCSGPSPFFAEIALNLFGDYVSRLNRCDPRLLANAPDSSINSLLGIDNLIIIPLSYSFLLLSLDMEGVMDGSA